MKLDSHSKQILITGINGFTGIHLESYFLKQGFEVYGTVVETVEKENHIKCDITKREEVDSVISQVRPDYVIHTAAISFTAENNAALIYDVNVLGTENILASLILHNVAPEKIIIASSATVYGNQGEEVLDESMCPKPVNHYGCSKLSMEYMISNYFDKLNIVITRPFNYTGPGQAKHFLIPKIVDHYKQGKKEIELGNLDVAREFNDVRDICKMYEKLLLISAKSITVNICSGNAIRLMDVIEMMNKLADYRISVKVNPEFVRDNEIYVLKGSIAKLTTLINYRSTVALEDTLKDMYLCE